MILDVVPLIKPTSGCDYHRVWQPMKWLGVDFEAAKLKPLSEHLSTAKVVTFNREPGIPLDTLMSFKKQYGFKILLDLDDYWYLYPHHLIYQYWMKNNVPKFTEDLIKMVDAVSCTTERLAEKIRPLNKEVFVIPNAVPYDDVIDNQFILHKERNNEQVQFGYVAGSSHLHDIKTIQGIFHQLPTLNFALAGYNNPKEKDGKKNVWDSMERIASFNYHNKNYRRLPTKELDTYMEHYDTLDVAIAPLEKNHFNTFKSSLKGYEAGVKKCAFIATDVAPYTDDIPRDIATFCDKTRDWVQAIKYHRDNPSFVKEQGLKLYEWVKENRSMEKVNQIRQQVFSHLINK